MNNTVLVGNLTKDVDLRYTSNGTAAGNFTLAVSRAFKNATGEKETDFINCVVWRKQAEVLAEYTGKGSKIAVRGRIQTRNYDNKEGQRVYVTEVVVEEFTFLDSKKNSDSNQGSYSKPKQESNSFGNNDPFDRSIGQPIDISDNDLPF